MRWRTVLPERPPPPRDGEHPLTTWRNAANIMTDIRRMIHVLLPIHEHDIEKGFEDDDDTCDDRDMIDALGDMAQQLREIDVWRTDELGEHARIDCGDNRVVMYTDIVIRQRAMVQMIAKEVNRAQGTEGYGRGGVWESLRNATLGQFDDIVKELDGDVTDAVNAMAMQLKSNEAKAWKDWVRRNIAAGARNAHRFLRLPEEWRPTTVLSDDGVTTAAPT